VAGPQLPADRSLVLDRVRIIDPVTGTDSGLSRITVTGSVIASITPAADAPAEGAAGPQPAVLDADGRYAVPGMVNAHDHLYSHELRDPLPGQGIAGMRALLDARSDAETLLRMLSAARAELACGITAIRDLGAPAGLNTVLAGLLDREVVTGPAVLASGRAVVMTGGHVWTFGREADGPWDCRRAVREQAKAGARVIKIMGSGGLSHYPAEDFTAAQFTDRELAAIIDESHRAGLPCCAHVFGADAVARVVRLGVDCVEHGVQIDPATLDLMAERGVGYVPTLTNMERIASAEYNSRAGTPERSEVLTAGVVRPHRDTVRRAIAAGVRIAVGTDSTGSYPEELRRLSDLGLSSVQVLAAATVAGAEVLRIPGGRIAVGQPADLALHRANPLQRLESLTAPDYVIRRGRVEHGPMVGLTGGTP
jgi:imidazolonepropionase-like amidohydrolase